MRIIYKDGKFSNFKKQKISIRVKGFQYGFGVFTTIKYDNNEIEFLSDHLDRLKISTQNYGMDFYDLDYKTIIKNLISKNSLTHARIKIIYYLKDKETGYIITAEKIKNINNKGIDLILSEEKRGNLSIYKYKTLNYMNNYKNILEFKDKNCDILNIDYNDNILETSTSNIFFIKKNKIVTPSEKQPILPGIIRKKILELKKVDNFEIFEENIKKQNIDEFDGVFL
ncbi:MAG TPA: aminotransferase class IV, partial [Candidatus Mcinerneyibacterium sp.]|nr:aminotransferase class IV [Candidatus Mcinerneyibacterium sp.]